MIVLDMATGISTVAIALEQNPSGAMALITLAVLALMAYVRWKR
jgi:4-hydroxybenzoate polyprenyltransferase